MARRTRQRESAPIDPGGPQRCRLPEWWSDVSPEELQASHDRARELIEGGWASVTWEEICGRR
jgi:hypothetical protein